MYVERAAEGPTKQMGLFQQPARSGAAAALVALAILGLLGSAHHALAATKATEEIGFFGDLGGTVRIRRGSETRRATYAVTIRQDDVVETGADGRAEVILPGEGFRSIIIPGRASKPIRSRAPAPRAVLDLAKSQVEAATYRGDAAWGPGSRLPRATAITGLPIVLDWRHLSPEDRPWAGRLTLYRGATALQRTDGVGSITLGPNVLLPRGQTYSWDLDLPGGRLVRGDFTYLDEAQAAAVDTGLAALASAGDEGPRQLALRRAAVLLDAGLLLRAGALLRDALATLPGDPLLTRWMRTIDHLLEQPSAESLQNTERNLDGLARLSRRQHGTDGVLLLVDPPRSSAPRGGGSDTGAPLRLLPGDRVTVRVDNRSPTPVDVTLLLASGGPRLSVLASPASSSARLPRREARAFTFAVTPDSSGRERLFMIAIGVDAGAETADASSIASPTAVYRRSTDGPSPRPGLAAVEDLLLRLRLPGLLEDSPSVTRAVQHLWVDVAEWSIAEPAE